MKVPEDLSDTLYPNGIYWREVDGIREYALFKDRREGDQPCLSIHCTENIGGCGCTLSADSEAELRNKWNTRVSEPDMRHPKIQSLISHNARLSIRLALVEDLLDYPDYETTAMDMEYWDSLHDKLKERLKHGM